MKIVQNCGFGDLGAAWGVSGESFLILGEDFFTYAQDGLRWRQAGAGTAQVGPCWRQDGTMVPKMVPVGSIFGKFEVDFGATFHMDQVAKVVKHIVF